MDPAPNEAVTVAFELAALEAIASPAVVFEQTHGWAAHVGIVSDRPTHAVTGFANTHGLDIGFHSGPRNVQASLTKVRNQPELEAERYVLIGTDERDPDLVRAAGWAFLTVEEAAAAANWSLSGDDDATDSSWL